MSKHEFLNELKNYLNEQLPASEVSRHIDYYRSYIESETGRGRSEAEVLNELGDPRIVGKSVIDSAKFSGHAGHSQTSYAESCDSKQNKSKQTGHIVFDTATTWGRIKLAAIVIMILAVIVVILRFAISLLMYILPALIVVGIISYFLRKK